MKKDLQTKLKKYSAAVAGIAAAGGAQGQVYTNISPDYVHTGGNGLYNLDLNNDGTDDFSIIAIDYSSVNGVRATIVAPYGTVGNEIGGSVPSGYNYALALNAGDMIDASVNWIAATNTMAFSVSGTNPYNENWNGVTDKYLALRFHVGANTYYGWARLNVQAIADQFTVKDYAYDSTGAGLAAGSGGAVGIDEVDMDQIVRFVNQPNNSILVRFNKDLKGGIINVVSTNGQQISSETISNETHIVDMNGLAAGIYMITVVAEEGTITKKMIVR